MSSNKLKLLGALLAPTFASIVTCGVLIALIGASSAIKYGRDGLYALLLGRDSSPEFINSAHTTYSTYYNNIFGNSTLNSILFFVFWMIIGLIVYIFIMILNQGISEADEVAHELNYVHIQKNELLEQISIKLGIRFAVILGIAVYSFLFLKTLLPFSLANLQIVAGSLPNVTGIGYGLIGILSLALSLHAYVVLIRLLFLRVRLFASD